MLLDPTQGDTDAMRVAVHLLNGYGQALVNDRTTADQQATIAGDGTWTGAAATDFATTMAGFSSTAAGIVDAWDRLASTLTDYASRLGSLQDEYRAVVNSLDPDASLSENGSALAALDDLRARRRALDAEIASTLVDAAGPGAALWIATTTLPGGHRLDDQTLVDTIVGRLTDGTITADDCDLVRQLLLQRGSDPALCDRLFTALGAQGTVDLLDGALTVHGLSDGDARRAQDLTALISGGLATASTAWDTTRCREFGADLVDTITDVQCSAAVTVPVLLSATGLSAQVGAGAMERVEQIRHEDPELFAHIGYERDPASLYGDAGLAAAALGVTGVTDLAASIFGNLSSDPETALDLFGNARTDASQDRIDYWFHERDWSLGGFTAPAELLASLITCPALQEGRYSIDADTPWAQVTGFSGRAFEGLGANQFFTVSSVSDAAAGHLVDALTPYIPEIAARAEMGEFKAENQLTFSGLGWIATATLDVNRGNLARLLGVTLAQGGALGSFGEAVNGWKADLVDALNAGPVPPAMSKVPWRRSVPCRASPPPTAPRSRATSATSTPSTGSGSTWPSRCCPSCPAPPPGRRWPTPSPTWPASRSRT